MANKDRKVPVIKLRKFSLTFSTILILTSIVVFFAIGFNLGIDFESGLSLKVQINNSETDINTVRDSLSEIDSVKVQMIGQESDMTFQVRINVDNDTESKAVQAQVLTDLETNFGQGNATILESNFIGAKFSDHL